MIEENNWNKALNDFSDMNRNDMTTCQPVRLKRNFHMMNRKIEQDGVMRLLHLSISRLLATLDNPSLCGIIKKEPDCGKIKSHEKIIINFLLRKNLTIDF
jgi:hypothetical protein